MTEPEEASSEVANKSRETPTMNALASIVQSVVEEMKAMNRRMDHLSEPINLEDKEIDYEEGELVWPAILKNFRDSKWFRISQWFPISE